MNTVPGQGAGASLLNGLSAQSLKIVSFSPSTPFPPKSSRYEALAPINQLAALSGMLGGQSALNQAQLAALTGSGIATPLSNPIASVSQQQSVVPVQNTTHVAVENKSSITGAAHTAGGAASDISLSSLPWPVVSPVMNVPHFDLSTYRLFFLQPGCPAFSFLSGYSTLSREISPCGGLVIIRIGGTTNSSQSIPCSFTRRC
ncbi:hypothetical protein ANCCAN_01322 [Ancylostoma caninum]|uniref:Uncharacterized protein n=1 Tax=Ancylostoma caninum TaxID=29170 RepID=A0A368H7N8_ANCCA|nr:hypothetical protein ANCCAN_01322 [Ancylostoma caninum]